MADSAIGVEAARLAQAVLAWAAQGLRGVEGAHVDGVEGCQACPACRFLTRVRAEDPELAAQLTDAIADTARGMAGLAELVAAAVSARRPTPQPDVEPITVVEDPGV